MQQPNTNGGWTPHVDYGTYGRDNGQNNYGGGNANRNNTNSTEGGVQPEEEIVLIDESREKRSFSKLGFGYAAFSLVSTAVAYVIYIIVLAIDTAFYNSTLFANLVAPVSLYLFALPVLLIIASRVEAKKPEKKKMGVGKWLLFLLVGFGVMYIGAIIGNTVMSYLSAITGYDYSNSLESIIDGDKLWLTAIFTVIVAPIGEELVFRKLIIDRTQKYGGAVCILLSALIFGLMHGNFYQLFYAFGLGLILGYMYYSTGRILPCMLIHAAVNLFGSVVSPLISPYLDGLADIDTMDIEAVYSYVSENLVGVAAGLIFTLFVYVAMALAIILPIVLRKRIKLGKPETKLPRGRGFAIVVGNAGVIVMLSVYALSFLLSLIPAA